MENSNLVVKPMFLEVFQDSKIDNPKSILINMAHIVSIFETNRGERIVLSDKSEFFIDEQQITSIVAQLEDEGMLIRSIN